MNKERGQCKMLSSRSRRRSSPFGRLSPPPSTFRTSDSQLQNLKILKTLKGQDNKQKQSNKLLEKKLGNLRKIEFHWRAFPKCRAFLTKKLINFWRVSSTSSKPSNLPLARIKSENLETFDSRNSSIGKLVKCYSLLYDNGVAN